MNRRRLNEEGDLPVPPVTLVLIAVNFVVFLVLEMQGSTQDGFFMLTHGALYGPSVLEDGEYYRLLTAAFLHFGAAHLMNNMLLLFLMGQRLEHEMGSVRFALVYFVSALGANAFTVFFYTAIGNYAVSAGASGALMGVIGALFARILKGRGSVDGIDRRQMVILIFFTLYSGFVSSSTNNAAHISGMLFGFLLGLIL